MFLPTKQNRSRTLSSLIAFPGVLKFFFLFGILALGASVSRAQDDRDRDAFSDDPIGQSRVAMPGGQERYLPPGQQPPTNFKLGIYSRNTSTGVLVSNVVQVRSLSNLELKPKTSSSPSMGTKSA